MKCEGRWKARMEAHMTRGARRPHKISQNSYWTGLKSSGCSITQADCCTNSRVEVVDNGDSN